MDRLIKAWLLGLIAIALTGAVAHAADVSDLSVRQNIKVTGGKYFGSKQVIIRFDLAVAGNVTVEIARHLRPTLPDTDVLADPVLVRTLKLGDLSAGHHQVIWDGLDQKGQPITEAVLGVQKQNFAKFMKKRAKNPAMASKPFDPMELIKHLPVNLFRVTVETGGSGPQAAVNFQRVAGQVSSWATTGQNLTYGVSEPNGDLLALSWVSGHAYRFDPSWSQLAIFPKLVAPWSSNLALQGSNIFEDHQGNVYASDGNGIFKYLPDGLDGHWSYKAPYIWDGVGRLGVKLDGKKLAKSRKPGFFLGGVGGTTIDQHGNIYAFGHQGKNSVIEVFAPSGKFLRLIPVAAPNSGANLHINKDGSIWASGLYCFNRLNSRTGDVEATIPVQSNLNFDSNGNILGWTGAVLERFTAAGKPYPFTAQSPYLITKSAYMTTAGTLSFALPKGVTHQQMPDRNKAINCVIPGIHGDFYVVLGVSSGGMNYGHEPHRPVIHFDHNGQVIPKLLSLTFGQDMPGNVFVGKAPAQVEVYATNLSGKPVHLNAQWTLTDFYGKTTMGQSNLTLNAQTHSVCPLVLNVPEYGWYKLSGTVKNGRTIALSFKTNLARVPSRSLKPSKDSPFAMCWGTNYYLSGVSGAKKERVGMTVINCAYAPGMLAPDDPAITNYRSGGQSGSLAEGLKWGVRQSLMLTYGEPSMGSSWMVPIYNYDQWIEGIVLPIMDRFNSPKNDLTHIQFWNEPGDFLYDNPADREHYALVEDLVWSLTKARDKGLQVIPDGDPGYYRMLQETLPKYGANRYCDAVPCHYPGSSMMAWNKLAVPNLLEGKGITLKGLVKTRDRYYPGEPVMVTEEGNWQTHGISAKVLSASVVRVMIPEIAAGADEVYWFAQNDTGFGQDASFMAGSNDVPWPAFCAYSTMTKHLQGAAFLSTVNLHTPATFGYLFGRGNQMVMPVWSVQGKPEIKLHLGVASVQVYDPMDHRRTVMAQDGVIHLRLSLQTQYVVFSKTAWSMKIIQARLKKQLKKLKLTGVSEIAQAIEDTCPRAVPGHGMMNRAKPNGNLRLHSPASVNAAMSRLYYLVQAARLAAYAGEAPAVAGGTPAAAMAKAAKAAITRREGVDGYLRRSRVALQWVERMARAVHRQGPQVGAQLTWAVQMAEKATLGLTQVETPCYPGDVVNAYVAGLGRIAKIRGTKEVANDPKTRIDAQFPLHIKGRPGSKFDLELTVYNFYQHSISGTVSPRLPAGWTATAVSQSYKVAPGSLARYEMEVSIPQDTPAGTYGVGGRTVYDGHAIHEIFTQKVIVK